MRYILDADQLLNIKEFMNQDAETPNIKEF